MKLDLHGVKHENVMSMVDDFLYTASKKRIDQVTIITGNSSDMKMIVKDIVNQNGFTCTGDYVNHGTLVVDLIHL